LSHLRALAGDITAAAAAAAVATAKDVDDLLQAHIASLLDYLSLQMLPCCPVSS